MRHYRTPGVYIEPTLQKIEPIKISKRCLVGFIGVAERGPLHEPVRITNFKEFLDIFGGFTTYGYLAYSLFGFFNAGGKECIVVRTAHLAKKQEESEVKEDQYAEKAYLEIANPDGSPAFKVVSTSEGTWGNEIQLKLWYAPAVSSKVLKDVQKTAASIEVSSVSEMKPGDVVCIHTLKKSVYREISGIKDNVLEFALAVGEDFSVDKEPVFCEKILVNVFASYKRITEETLYLSLNRSDSDYFVKEINRESRIIRIEETGPAGIPSEVYFKNLNCGRNGIMGLTPADFIGRFKGLVENTGLGIFQANDDINVLVCPDLLVFEELIYKEAERQIARDSMFAVQQAMIDQCRLIGNRFAILDCPVTDNPIDILKWRDRFDTDYAALYYPRIEMINPEDSRGLTSLLVPPSGHIAGTYVDCDIKEGIYRAPANRVMSGVVGVERIIENEEYEMLYPRGINCMKYMPGRGVKVWGVRTLSSNPDWKYINVRRTYGAIRDALRKGSGWAVFEPNSPALRKRLVRQVSAFLLDLWREGYMRGDTPDEGFYVRCDDEVNPPEDIENGIIHVVVGLSIARPAEFLVVRLTANMEDSMVLVDT